MRSVLGIVGLAVGLAALGACSSGGGSVGIPGAPQSGTQEPGGPGTTEEPREPGDEGTSVPKSVTDKLASGVTITEVAVFQGVKASVAKEGKKATPGVPLVAQRDALVRVYFKPIASAKGSTVKAILRLIDSDGNPLKAFSDTKTISGTASSDASLDSTFNFNVPGSALPLGVKFAVSLTTEDAEQAEEGAESPARYPLDGTEIDLGVKSAGPSLRVVVVPVKYTADGSNRLPDTSAAQLEIMRNTMWSMFPAPEVEITVRQPFTWSSPVRGSGQGWSALLQAIIDLREQDGADDDVYYWGAFAAASSQQSFCGAGCVLGLSTVVSDPRNSFFRASIGVGFKGQSSAETMAHEIGHAHGRNHAPCSDFGQIDGVDPSFPHQGAQLGAWGFDLVSKKLRSPTGHADFMGYCNPAWVSDYTYKALFDRIATLNKGKALPPPTNNSAGSNANAGSGGFQSFQFVSIGADGPESFGQKVTPRSAPHGEAREVQLLDESGRVKSVVRGEYFPYSHLPGGLLMVPDRGISYAGVKVSGYNRVLSR